MHIVNKRVVINFVLRKCVHNLFICSSRFFCLELVSQSISKSADKNFRQQKDVVFLFLSVTEPAKDNEDEGRMGVHNLSFRI